MSNYNEHQRFRPPGQHRLSTPSMAPSTMPTRHTSARPHAHSVSLGTMNSSHRVSRRKSMTSPTSSNMAALVAAVEGSENSGLHGSAHPYRRSLGLLNGSLDHIVDRPRTNDGSTLFYDDNGLPRASRYQIPDTDATGRFHTSAVLDDDLLSNEPARTIKPRGRRASEGTYLSKSEAKRASGELKCDQCGKGYKHSSCLTKHLWEHTPEWAYTSKLLISKHQQVQLLEAASVLVGMNQNSPEVLGVEKPHDSDHSSSSPVPSGSSEAQDDYISSAETTPPPTTEALYNGESFRTARPSRHSRMSSSSAFSRSYQSAPSSSFPKNSHVVMGSSYGRSRSPGHRRRPSSSSYGSPSYPAMDEDTASLAAAVELVNFGTPNSQPVHLPADVPPVPPLPARYAVEHSNGPVAPSVNQGNSVGPRPDLAFPSWSVQTLSNMRGAPEEPNNGVEVEQGLQTIQGLRQNDYDEGVFGQMEE